MTEPAIIQIGNVAAILGQRAWRGWLVWLSLQVWNHCRQTGDMGGFKGDKQVCNCVSFYSAYLC